MRKFFASLVIGFTGIASVWACCWASAGDPVWMKSEKAIIVWNAAKKMEHFIRQVDFDTEAKDFGFIVPLPSVPDFAVADEESFEILEELYQSERMKGVPTDSAAATAESVEVLKTEQVGDYKATVVRATDGAAMNAWLGDNGFKSRPQMTEWLGHYTRKQWVFAALKYNAKPDSTTKTNAIRISFKTDKPHYPYKMPTDAFKPGWVRPLRLYVVSSAGTEALFAERGDRWVGDRLWSGEMKDHSVQALAEGIDMDAADMPTKATLTVFKNAETETKYDEDLVFAHTTPTGGNSPWLWGVLALVLVATWLFTQRNRRRFVPNPA